MEYQIVINQYVAPTTRYLKLVPLNLPITHRAGQYVALQMDNESYYFTIANAPVADGSLEFYIRETRNDASIQKLIHYFSQHGMVKVLGPFGECIYHYYKNRPVIFLVGGVGISQTKAILEQALANHDERHFYLYWNVSCRENLFLLDTLEAWREQLRHFQYHLIFTRESEPHAEKIGLARDYLIHDFPDLAHVMVYCSGPWNLIDEALPLLQQHGLPRKYVFSDRFAF